MKKNVWLKSSRSGDSGACLMCMHLDDGSLIVKDSKDPDGPVLTFTAREWKAFVDGVKASEFDL